MKMLVVILVALFLVIGISTAAEAFVTYTLHVFVYDVQAEEWVEIWDGVDIQLTINDVEYNLEVENGIVAKEVAN